MLCAAQSPLDLLDIGSQPVSNTAFFGLDIPTLPDATPAHAPAHAPPAGNGLDMLYTPAHAPQHAPAPSGGGGPGAGAAGGLFDLDEMFASMAPAAGAGAGAAGAAHAAGVGAGATQQPAELYLDPQVNTPCVPRHHATCQAL